MVGKTLFVRALLILVWSIGLSGDGFSGDAELLVIVGGRLLSHEVLHGQFEFGLILFSLPLESSLTDQLLYTIVCILDIRRNGCPSLYELAL